MRPGWWIAFGLALLPADGGLERVGRLDAPALVEASGIVQSRRYPGTFWVHNDSGNAPTLFAVRKDGTLIRAYAVGVPNVDWEDIALDDAGHLYLADTGNNGLRLPIRAIHRFDEPDPSIAADRPLAATLSIYYRFPEGGRFDAEALFLDGGFAHLITKRSDGKPAEIFRLDLSKPAPLLRPAVPERLGHLAEGSGPVTGADLASDGTRLAVVTLDRALVLGRDGEGGWRRIGSMRFEAPDVEAICWDGRDLILASEDRSLYRIAEARWRLDR